MRWQEVGPRDHLSRKGAALADQHPERSGFTELPVPIRLVRTHREGVCTRKGPHQNPTMPAPRRWTSSPQNREQPPCHPSTSARVVFNRGFPLSVPVIAVTGLSARTASLKLSLAPLGCPCRWRASPAYTDAQWPGVGLFLACFLVYFSNTNGRLVRGSPGNVFVPDPTLAGRVGSAATARPAPAEPARGPRLSRSPLQMRLGSGAPPPSASNYDAFW